MAEAPTIKPPEWPLKLLRFFVKKEYLEEIEGDMEELFHEQVERTSAAKARRMYTLEMIKLLRPILIKNLEGVERLNQYGMFKNYFKVSVRGLIKNPFNSSINIVGLSIAIGFAVFGYSFARWTYSTDQFHKNKDVVFLTTFTANREGTMERFGKSPRPLGEQLLQDFPQIKKVCRVEDRIVVVKYEDHIFNERVRFTDPEFMEMFTFPLKWGVAGSLTDINSTILSERAAIKYFGDENPIGQSILVRFDKTYSKAFKVTGVAEKFPFSRSFEFDFLINLDNFRTALPEYDFQDWKALINATFVQVDKPGDLKVVETGMTKYRKLYNAAEKEDWAISSFAFEPLATLHERSGKIKDDISRSSEDNYTTVYFMLGITIFLLTLACFNYINIAIATAAKRLKEIAVRKSIGASRGVVITQFLTENIVVTFFALLLGLALGSMGIIPWFEGLWHFDMGFTLNDKVLWVFLPAILFITGIASGIYPAFYISQYQVVGILKGSVKFGTSNPVTRLLLCIQLILAFLFISGSVVFTQNWNFLAQRGWGYSQHGALYLAVPDRQAFEQVEAMMAREPSVIMTSGSTHHLGKSNTTAILHFPVGELGVDQLTVGANYMQTLGLELESGRFFNSHAGSDRTAVLINEFMVKTMGWEDAIGKQFRIDSVQYDVIGVVRDFHSYNFELPIRPTIFLRGEEDQFKYLSLRTKPGLELATFRILQKHWASLYPEIPFNGGFQEDVWGGYHKEQEIYGQVWSVVAGMAILLASLGLYGLVTLNVSGRVREFSIRKVMGANARNIAANIAKQYWVLFAVALSIGAPLSYMTMKAMMDMSFPVHVPVTFQSIILGFVILLLIPAITIATQVGKVVKANPVEGLKVGMRE